MARREDKLYAAITFASNWRPQARALASGTRLLPNPFSRALAGIHASSNQGKRTTNFAQLDGGRALSLECEPQEWWAIASLPRHSRRATSLKEESTAHLAHLQSTVIRSTGLPQVHLSQDPRRPQSQLSPTMSSFAAKRSHALY